MDWIRNIINILNLGSNLSTIQTLLLLDCNFEKAIILKVFLVGNENTMSTLINSTSISVSWNELQYCFSDYHIQYEITYYEVLFYNDTRTITINITDILDPLSNTTSCIPQFVLLTDLTPSVTYFISLRVTIDELGVTSTLIAEICKGNFEISSSNWIQWTLVTSNTRGPSNLFVLSAGVETSKKQFLLLTAILIIRILAYKEKGF